MGGQGGSNTKKKLGRRLAVADPDLLADSNFQESVTLAIYLPIESTLQQQLYYCVEIELVRCCTCSGSLTRPDEIVWYYTSPGTLQPAPNLRL